MVRLPKTFIIVLVGLVPAGVVLWLQWPAPKVLDVTSISNLEFHDDLQRVGFDEPRAAGAFQPLVWNRGVHSEAEVTELIRSLDLAPATLAAEPHTDLVSTQSSIKVQVPVLNSILAWSNATTDLWILRQRYMENGAPWLTYAIVQDKTVTPNRAFYAGIGPSRVAFAGNDCFHCHASGPRFIRPIRTDLIIGHDIAAAFNNRIASDGYVETHFSASDPAEPTGPALRATACVTCHQIGAERAPLYHLQDPSIRALVATGAMPRDGRLSAAQAAELQAWFERRRE
jgi:hypothetical protein